MATFLVTVKLAKNPGHNPREKQTGPCPVSGLPCTDVTGEHHTLMAQGRSAEDVKAAFETEFHVTRVEAV